MALESKDTMESKNVVPPDNDAKNESQQQQQQQKDQPSEVSEINFEHQAAAPQEAQEASQQQEEEEENVVPQVNEPQLQGLLVEFDNEEDPDATVIRVTGQDKTDLLMALTGGFNSLDLRVNSASISSNNDEGRVMDVFHITTASDQQIPESEFDSIKSHLLAICASTSRSSKPAIYGLAAEAEVRRLRPLSTSPAAMEGDAAALELAAAEMAQAAAHLVSLERDIISTGGTQGAEGPQERERAEAAAQLERRMAAMEAVLAARRSTATEQLEPTMSQVPGGDARFAGGGTTSTGPAAGNGFEIILQGFNWESHRGSWYKTIADQAKEISEAGFTAIWMPPPSASVSPQGYLPTDLYNLNSKYGAEEELRDCINKLHEAGLKAIADIVINHRCAATQDTHGKWNKFGGRLAWDKSAICFNNPTFGGTGNAKTGEDYEAAPNVDHTQEKVRNDITSWLKFLRTNVGFDGWRFDFVKGYAGKFTRHYIDNTVPDMAFGEFWDTCDYTDGVLNYNQDAHRQRTVSWCDQTGGTAGAFDFSLKGILQEAMGRGEYWRLTDSQGRPPGVLGMWPSRAVTFIDNHDTGSTLNHWPFPSNHLAEGYAYLLTHPGTPCVFYDHFFDKGPLGETIAKLIDIRRRNGINSRSKVKILGATSDVYAASIDSKIVVKVGYGNWSPRQSNVDIGQRDWGLAHSGPNFAIWEGVF